MAKKPKTIKTGIILLFLFVTWRCANQLPPGGGPIDTIPPQIVEVYPHNGTIQYNKNYFEIKFSEYVDKRTVRDAIFISPPLKYGIEFNWSGKSLKLVFKDTLKDNTTYTITIGASVSDLNNNNKMSEPYTFAFSTGEVIDEGKISGRIYDSDPIGVMVYAYKASDEKFNPNAQKPDYVSQVGKNGRFTLLGLGDGKYYILAIKDRFMDLLYQIGDDFYGVQSFQTIINQEKRTIDNVDFFLTVEDTIAPQISYLFMKNANQILVEFSKPIDSIKTTVENFYLYDSSTSNKISLLYFFKGDAKSKQYYLSLNESLNPENRIYLVTKNVTDRFNNVSKKEETLLTVKTDKDTTPVKILKVITDYPDGKVDYDEPTLIINLDKGINKTKVEKAISVIDNKEANLNYDISFIDDASFKVLVKHKLLQKTEYKLRIDLKYLEDASGNSRDSIYTYKFITASELDFSGVSGSVVNNIDENNSLVILESADREKKKYQQTVRSNRNFEINKVLPGKYILWSFIDKDDDKVYTHGKINPFSYSERFKFYSDTLNLRARWPIGDIQIEFNK